MHPLSLLAALKGRLRALFLRKSVEAGLAEEILGHIEMETDRLRKTGLSDTEARRAALINFGGVDRVTEAHRDARGTRWLEDAMVDVRYGARAMARTPLFAGVSILTIALAIGVGAVLFSGVHGFVHRPLPVPQGAKLLAVWTSDSDGSVQGGNSYADVESFVDAASGVADFAGESRTRFAVTSGDETVLVSGVLVTPDYWRTLQVRPALGAFAPVERDAPSVVLSYGLWRRAFAADPSIAGKPIRINGHAFRVAAVAPPKFIGVFREEAVEAWIDARFADLLQPGNRLIANRGWRTFNVVARLRDGTTADALQSRLSIVAERLHADMKHEWSEASGRGRRITVLPEQAARLGETSRNELLLLVGGVALSGLALLALATTNLACLQLARAAARRQEIATRLALGAAQARLVRQLLAESAAIALPGAALGLALAAGFAAAATRYRPPGLPNIDLSIDPAALLYVAGALVLALLVFGLLPALQGARVDMRSDLNATNRSGRGASSVGKVRGTLIAAQVALSMMFAASSALIAVTLAKRVAGSGDGDRVIVAPLTILPGDSARAAAAIQDLVAELPRIPGVMAASAAAIVPNSGSRIEAALEPVGSVGLTSGTVDINLVLPEYFAVTGIPLLRGRDFTTADLTSGSRAVIVSHRFAARHWPGQDALGKQLVRQPRQELEVVGVVGEASEDSASAGLLYLPMASGSRDNLVLHARVRDATPEVRASIARALRDRGTHLVATEVSTLNRYKERTVMPHIVGARASAIVAALQLALALAGLSGLVAYATAQRRGEIGIRMALGASGRSILGLVLREGVMLTAIGSVAGAILSVVAGQFLISMMPMRAAFDARPVIAAAVLLLSVAGTAMWLTARRALLVQPATALRAE